MRSYGVKSLLIMIDGEGNLADTSLAEIMKAVNKPICGTLPDPGNFYEYDRFKGVA